MKPGTLNNLRPHQLVHQLAIIVVASNALRAGWAPIAGSVGVAVLGLAASMLLNDYTHREEDIAMGRDRPVQRLSPAAFVTIFCATCSATLVLAALLGGAQAAAAGVALFVATGCYGLAKHKRLLWLTYLGRFAMGICVFIAYWSYFGHRISTTTLLLALASATLDLAGNLAGDLRDDAGDRAAQLRTLPIVAGERTSLAIIVVLNALAHVPILTMAPSAAPVLISCALWTSVALALYRALPTRWAHGSFHGPKLMMLTGVGAFVGSWPWDRALVIGAALALAWIAAYRAYASTIDGRHPAPSQAPLATPEHSREFSCSSSAPPTDGPPPSPTTTSTFGGCGPNRSKR